MEKTSISDIIYMIDDTFARDDIGNVGRDTLEELVIRIYDELHQINEQ